MIDVKHVHLLAAIAQEGTLSAAARRLGYSQPGVTQQIQALERRLGTPVILRHSTGTRLTEAGQIILGRGRGAVDALALAAAEVAAISHLEAGRVRLASFPSAAATLIPPAFGQLHRNHPGLQFSLSEAEPAAALAQLRAGQVEIALVYQYLTLPAGPRGSLPRRRWPTLADEVVTELLTEEVYVALPPGHPVADAATVDLGDLADEHWVAGCPSCRGSLIDACAGAGFEPRISFETDDYVALHGLVSQGLGVALMPDLMLRAARRDAGLNLRPLTRSRRRVVAAVSTEQLAGVAHVAATMAALANSARNSDSDITSPGK